MQQTTRLFKKIVQRTRSSQYRFIRQPNIIFVLVHSMHVLFPTSASPMEIIFKRTKLALGMVRGGLLFLYWSYKDVVVHGSSFFVCFMLLLTAKRQNNVAFFVFGANSCF